MNSSFLLAVKVQMFNFLLAAGNPFDGAGQLVNDLQGKVVKFSLIALAFVSVIVFAIYGACGQEIKKQMKNTMGGIILAVIGISAVVGGAIGWLAETSGGWFGG